MARISNSELVEKLESLDFEQYLQIEGIAFRRTTGKSGRELNIRECPTCGNHSWKVYFNPKTNVGVCFAGSHPQDEQFNTYRFLKEYSGLRGRDLNGYIDSQLLEQGWQPKKKRLFWRAVSILNAKSNYLCTSNYRYQMEDCQPTLMRETLPQI